MAERRGILIAFEGIDGAGKTTQAKMLREALSKAGFDVVSSKEPTDGKWGRKVRESAKTGRLPAQEEVEAFLKDRAEHVAELIRPALEAGKVVILDRYFYSTVAYQGARGIRVEDLDQTNREMAPIPDKVVLLDLDPAVAIARISEGRNEAPNLFEKVEYLRDVRAIFNRLSELHPEIARFDGADPIADLHKKILGTIVDGPVKDRQ